MRKRSIGEREGCTSSWPCLTGGGLADLTDFVLWVMAGDSGLWAGRIGDRGRKSSSRSGVRERPSESLKLFSLGIAGQVVEVVKEGRVG